MKFLKFIVKVVAYCLVMPVVFVFSVVFFWNLIIPFFGVIFSIEDDSTGSEFLERLNLW